MIQNVMTYCRNDPELTSKLLTLLKQADQAEPANSVSKPAVVNALCTLSLCLVPFCYRCYRCRIPVRLVSGGG